MILRKLQVGLISNCQIVNQVHTAPPKTFLDQVSNKVSILWKKFNRRPINMKPPFGHCVQVGDPILRHRAPEVPVDSIKSAEIQNIISKMKKVHRDYKLVGLAAPQIGISLRIIIIEASEELKEKYPAEVYKNRQMEIMPLTVFINPVLNIKNFNQLKFPEGCGSVCGYTGEVKRYEEVLLSGLNEKGQPKELHLKGWNARIAQHEVDHLNGQVYVDIMEPKSFSCVAWESVNRNAGQISIPFYPTKHILKGTVVK